MNNPREYRKKYGEHFFKSLPPQTSMPLVLLLMLLVFSGIHYMMLKHKQGEYNAAVMKICFENRGPKDDGTKASQEVHKRAKDLLKQRLANNEAVQEYYDAAASNVNWTTALFAFIDKVLGKKTTETGSAKREKKDTKKAKKGNPSAVLNDERKLKTIIKEILQEENYWQADPKVTDTLMFALGSGIWFKITSFGRDRKQE